MVMYHYAVSLGFHITKVGRYYSLKEHDSVRIDTEKNCFWRNSNGASGSVIDFAIEFTNMPIEDIIGNFVEILEAQQILPTEDKVNQEVIKKTKELILPASAKNMKNVYAYLISARGIDSEIISKFVKDKMLYQDIYSNCVFVCRKDGIPVYAYKNGTNTYKPFKGDVEGCNYDYCFFINNHSKEIIVTEAIIDAMSIMTLLKQKGKDYAEMLQGLVNYNEKHLNTRVVFEDLNSMYLKGFNVVGKNEIHVNNMFGETQQLSTLIHETGHQILHQDKELLRNRPRIEFEADAFSIMAHTYLGLDIEENRKAHMVKNFKQMMEIYRDDNKDMAADEVRYLSEVMGNIMNISKMHMDDIVNEIDRTISKNKSMENKVKINCKNRKAEMEVEK